VGAKHLPALLEDEHRVERAEPGAAVLLGHEQPGPARLDDRGPQVGQRGAVLEPVAGGLDRLHAGEQVARGVAQELLLVGEGEVHREDPLSWWSAAAGEQ
jgi:hypothetical protein